MKDLLQALFTGYVEMHIAQPGGDIQRNRRRLARKISLADLTESFDQMSQEVGVQARFAVKLNDPQALGAA